MTNLNTKRENWTHGKYIKAEQRRTQESQTRLAQEAKGGKAAEAAGICTRLEEEQGEEAGARSGEAVKQLAWRLGNVADSAGLTRVWPMPECRAAHDHDASNEAPLAQPPSSNRGPETHSHLGHPAFLLQVDRQADLRLGRAERRLKKTLGPVSLTALGIGAVIGSGIFTVIGTAIAGQKFDTSSILNAPLLDFLIKHTATTRTARRRAGAGAVARPGGDRLRVHRRCATPNWRR